MQEQRSPLLTAHAWFYFGFIVVISFFTYFYNYNQPAAVYWDEPYHIASAQKYLNGVFFMEQHPPLGKLLIAAGEKIFHSNAANNQFIDTDYARNFPAGFSFTGYRFFPALLAWLTAPLLFLIFLFITRNGASASLFSFLYVFDNALIVHNRGAMVDSPLVFFSVLMMLLFVLLLQPRSRTGTFVALSAGFGLTFGLIMTTKLVGLIMILLYLPLLWHFFMEARRRIPASTKSSALSIFLKRTKTCGVFLLVSLAGFLVSFISVWQIHFTLSKTINPKLNNYGYYDASDNYKRILALGQNGSLLSFPLMLRDSMRYVTHYNSGVPRLDLCKADENGSPFYFWPFGARSINYRWESAGTDTYRYLYLQVNPVTWLCGLIGVLFSACLLVNYIFFGGKKPKHLLLLLTFLGMYVSYMIAVSTLHRVMYLYHYFAPLTFSFVLFAVVFENIERIGRVKVNEHLQLLVLTVLGIFIFASFQFYRPLSYYTPISNRQFAWRDIFGLWELHCVNCEHVSGLVVPSH